MTDPGGAERIEIDMGGAVTEPPKVKEELVGPVEPFTQRSREMTLPAMIPVWLKLTVTDDVTLVFTIRIARPDNP
jgi:hypothetical protein